MDSTPEPEATKQILTRLARMEERLSQIARDVQELQEAKQWASRPAPPKLPPLAAVAPAPDATSSLNPIPAAPPFATPVSTAAAPSQSPVRELPPPLPSAQRPGLEAMIGQRWTSWLGGLVLILGISFFLKYAWDQGWIRPSPAARVIAAIALGLVVAGLGEWVYRKQMAALAAALYGTGLAIVIASLFGAHTFFSPPVLARNTAFAAVAIVAAAGVAMALRVDMVTLAVLALLGAYLSPAVLRSGEDKSVELLTYVGLLAALGLVLAHLKRLPALAAPGTVDAPPSYHRWNLLRWLVLGGTAVWFFTWWEGFGARNDHWRLGLAWAAILYLCFLTEAFLAVQRTIVSEHSQAQGDSLSVRSLTAAPWMVALDGDLAALALLATAWAFAGAHLLLARFPQQVLGEVAVALAVVQGALALTTVSRRYMYSALLQAAALLTLAVPLLFDQFSITIAWLALAAVVAALGWQLDLKASRAWAVVLLVLGTMRLLFFDRFMAPLTAVIFKVADQPVSRWLLACWGVAALFHIVGWLKPQRVHWAAAGEWLSDIQRRKVSFAKRERNAGAILDYATPVVPQMRRGVDVPGVLLAGVGTLFFAIITAQEWDGPWLTFVAVLWLWAIVLLAPFGRQLLYAQHALIFALLLSVEWFAVNGLLPLTNAWDRPDLDRAPPLVNVIALDGLLLCAAIGGLGRQLYREAGMPRANAPKSDRNALWIIVSWVTILLFALVNFETWRTVDFIANHRADGLDEPAMVKQMATSVLWSVLGFAGIVIGFARRIAPLRYAALLLLAATLAKILLIDMANVQAVWRILSFVAVGALLLCVSYVYNRYFQSKLRTPEVPPADPVTRA